MTAHLLPHEAYCSTCNKHGEGKYRGRTYSDIERAYVTCPECDGADGIVACDSREHRNRDLRAKIDALDAAHREHVALIVRAEWRRIDALEREVYEARNRQRQAERECDRLRVIVRAQARLLDKSQPITPPSPEEPHGADIPGSGTAGQVERVQ